MSEFGLPADATGPFVLSGYSGYKQVQVPRGRLFAFDSEGNYMLTCSATGGVIYKVRGGVRWCHGGLGASSLEGSARLSRASVANPAPHGPGGAFDPGSSKPPKPPAASYSQLRQSSEAEEWGQRATHPSLRVHSLSSDETLPLFCLPSLSIIIPVRVDLSLYRKFRGSGAFQPMAEADLGVGIVRL